MYKTKVSIVAMLMLFASSFLAAQSTSNSPYSRFGIGDLFTKSNIKNLSMGGTSIAERNPFSVNIANPASYSAFDTLSFVFETGLTSKLYNLSTSSVKTQNYNTYLDHMLFGFPIAKRLGASFGLVPFSAIGYNITDKETIDSIGAVSYLYKGLGGLNQLYVGSAYSITKNISLGFNAAYVFGNIIQDRSVSFPTGQNFFDQYTSNTLKVGDVKFDLGFQYQAKIKEDLKITFGGTYYLASNMNAKSTLLSRTYRPSSSSSTQIVRDTTQNEILNSGEISLPSGLAFGFMIEKDKKWGFRADISQVNWSDYKIFGKSDSLLNSMRASFGFEFVPDAKGKGMLKKSYYRIGGHYENSYLQLKNNQISDYGVSLGIGIPVRGRANKPSYINLAVEVGTRGTTNYNLIKEDYIKFSVGFSFYENWFHKRKYD